MQKQRDMNVKMQMNILSTSIIYYIKHIILKLVKYKFNKHSSSNLF